MLQRDRNESVRICVVSDSPDPIDVLEGHLLFTVTTSKYEQAIPQADLYIWNYSPECNLHSLISARGCARHFLLADPNDLDRLGDLQTSACILLKPLSAFRFRAFAELAWKSLQLERCTKEADSIRSDRNNLLQYVLNVNLKLQEHDQERSHFLARAVHDLRTPLTALHGFCSLLSDGKAGAVTPVQQVLLNRMKDSTKRLAQMAAGALDLLLEGRYSTEIQVRPEDFGETLSRAVQDVYAALQEKAIQLRVDIQPPFSMLSFDSGQIQRVLVNLLENSCKFTPREGTIDVRAYPVCVSGHLARASCSQSTGSTNNYRVDISDSGPGIRSEYADTIFEQYASCASETTRASSGLGLAICRNIIRAHSGEIWATPSSQGGHFSFVLPSYRASENSSDHNLDHISKDLLTATLQRKEKLVGHDNFNRRR